MAAANVKILLVEDDPATLSLAGRWLKSAGYTTEYAQDGEQAIAAIQTSCPQMVITDWEMPKMDGLELCRWLRQQELPHYVYTVFVTKRTNSDDMVQALEAGADDFLKKPVDKVELLARVHSGVRLLDLERRFSDLARLDPLTELATRRTFFELMEREWNRSRRHSIPLSCVMVDVDYFKRINDTYGHRVGDQALRKIADILGASCRDSDVVGRYGGEEFCVLLPETSEEDAVLWAERARKKIAVNGGLDDKVQMAITASFGVAQRLADTSNPEQFVDLADQALLVAKRSGRDRVVGFSAIREVSQVRGGTGRPGAMFHGVTAGQVMATVVAGLNEEDTVGHAAHYFLRFRFNSAPVVNQGGQLAGILSQRDVMTIMLWPKWWMTKIKDVMKRNVVCYEEDTPVLMIYEFLCRVSIRGVVIVKDGIPTGMISRTSLLRWFTNLLAVNPTAMSDGSAPEGDESSQANPAPRKPRDNVALIVQALAGEARNLERHVQEQSAEFVPNVVGGASRLEELINDLLAASRYSESVLPPSETTAGDEPATPSERLTVRGAAEFADGVVMHGGQSAAEEWFPSGGDPPVPSDSA